MIQMIGCYSCCAPNMEKFYLQNCRIYIVIEEVFKQSRSILTSFRQEAGLFIIVWVWISV